MHLVREDEGQVLARSDSPWLGSHALVFHRETLGRLESILLSHGELLPIACSEADLVIFNATRILPALDDRASDMKRLSNGRPFRITRYSFRSEVIAGVDLFKIPDFRVSPIYLSERFVESVKSAGLRGLVFEKVWSDVTAG